MRRQEKALRRVDVKCQRGRSIGCRQTAKALVELPVGKPKVDVVGGDRLVVQPPALHHMVAGSGRDCVVAAAPRDIYEEMQPR